MKKTGIILLLLIPFGGFSQSPGMAEKSMAAPAPAAAMEYTFTTNVLDEPQVGAFQQRGIQKLKDFYNYLTIISNSKYDKRLREDAKNQAKELFYGSDCSVDGKMYADYIDSCFNLQKGGDFKAVNLIVSQPMNATADAGGNTIYKGELAFNESKDGVVSGGKKAEIVLSKSEKQFGGSKKEVWSIYICLIE